MNNTSDPTVTDEARHDRDCQRNRKAFKLAIDQARAEFRTGELDDLIDERISEQAMDARNIALHALFPDEIVRFEPSETDFINMVEQIITERIDEIMDES